MYACPLVSQTCWVWTTWLTAGVTPAQVCGHLTGHGPGSSGLERSDLGKLRDAGVVNGCWTVEVTRLAAKFGIYILQFVGFTNNITTYLSWLTPLYTQMKPTVSDDIYELVHWFMVANRPAKVTEGAPPCNRGWYDNHWGIQPTKLEGNNQSSWRYDRSVWKWVGYNKDGHKPIWGNYVQVFLGRRLNLLWSLEPSDFVHFLCVLTCLRQLSKLLHAEKKKPLDSTIWHCQVLSANKKE